MADNEKPPEDASEAADSTEAEAEPDAPKLSKKQQAKLAKKEAKRKAKQEKAEAKRASSEPVDPGPDRQEDEDDGVVYTTKWYWVFFIGSLAAFLLSLLFFDRTLPLFFVLLAYLVVAISGIMTVSAGVGLVRRYQLIARVKQKSLDVGRSGVQTLKGVKGAAGRSTQALGGVARFFAKIVGFVRWVLLAVYRTVLWSVYLVEATVIWAIILVYDLVFGVLYAAWVVGYHLIRVAWIVLKFLLKVAWAVVGLPTKLPGIKKPWKEKAEPAIKARWRESTRRRQEKWAASVERRRKMVEAAGHEPDEWEKEKRRRKWFPLPEPHHAKDALKKRLDQARKDRVRRSERGFQRLPKEEREKRREAKKKARLEHEAEKERAKARKEKLRLEKKRAKQQAKDAKKSEKKAGKAAKASK